MSVTEKPQPLSRGRVCRLCLGVLAALEHPSSALLARVRQLLSVQIKLESDNILPNKFCTSCIDKVHVFYDFFNLALSVEKQLLNLLSQGEEHLQNFYKTLLSENIVKQEDDRDSEQDNKENVFLDNSEELVEWKVDGDILEEDQIKTEPEMDNEDQHAGSTDDDMSLSVLQGQSNQDGRTIEKTENNTVKLQNDEILTPQEIKVWQCLTCFELQESKQGLLVHYDGHLDTQPLKESEECVRDGDNSSRYRVVGTSKYMAKSCQCIECGKLFEYSAIRRHLKSHNEKRPYACNMCGLRFRSAPGIMRHGRAHDAIKNLACTHEGCEYGTVDPNALASHEKRHEGLQPKYMCTKCDKGYEVKSRFDEHQNMHTGDKPFKCDKCEDAFHFSRDLTTHLKTHPGTVTAPTYNCHYCPQQFKMRRHMLRHRRTEHRGLKRRALCDICGKELSSRDHLRLHRRIHLEIKPHACGTCGKGFVKKYNLTLHERVHSGEKPYVCSHCGKAFSQRSTLVIHARSHTGSRPYPCNTCPKRFVCSGLLTTHRKVCTRGTELAGASTEESADTDDSDE